MSAEKKLEVCIDDSQVEIRKWEDLSMDCLVNVFGRVGMESLILDVPFVCKSWYNATCNPLCWQNLDFSTVSSFPFLKPSFQQRIRAELHVKGKIGLTAFVKSVLLRSSGFATKIVFPRHTKHEALVLAANVCPALKTLELPRYIKLNYNRQRKLNTVKDLIRKWKNLESLTLKSGSEMTDILEQIGIHCKNFVCLSIKGIVIYKCEALAIVTHLPNIKSLSIRQCYIEGADLATILKDCNRLCCFDTRNCNVHDGGNGREILEVPTQIGRENYLSNKNYCYLEFKPELLSKVDLNWSRMLEWPMDLHFI
ncbi:hypothetical protein LguiA_001804 [Lonicera macranthoides]